MNKIAAALVLLCWIVLGGNAEAGIGYGRGGPNRYAKSFILDLSTVADQIDPIIKSDKPQRLDFVRIERDLEEACEGKCSDQNLSQMKTIEEDKEQVKIIRETIYRQILRILLQIRENQSTQALREWDEVMMKLKKMRLELLGTGSSTVTGSVVIHREKS